MDIIDLNENPNDSLTLDSNGYNINLKIVQAEGSISDLLSKSLTKYLNNAIEKHYILGYNISEIGNTLNLEIKWKKRKV